MTKQQIRRALSNRPNGHTERIDIAPTMSEHAYTLEQIARIDAKHVPDIARVLIYKALQPIYVANDHHYDSVQAALEHQPQPNWKLADHYVDKDGLYLVYLPSTEEMATIAQQRLDSISNHFDNEEEAKVAIALELFKKFGFVIRVRGDFEFYLDHGDTADCVIATINSRAQQGISISPSLPSGTYGTDVIITASIK